MSVMSEVLEDFRVLEESSFLPLSSPPYPFLSWTFGSRVLELVLKLASPDNYPYLHHLNRTD